MPDKLLKLLQNRVAKFLLLLIKLFNLFSYLSDGEIDIVIAGSELVKEHMKSFLDHVSHSFGIFNIFYNLLWVLYFF
jgi:hypothetical protein